MRVLGIDEAGRGCVLGPLVVGGFVIEGDQDAALRAIGVDDSKKLTAARREETRGLLGPLGKEQVCAISAREIDQGNLNALEEAAVIEMVRRWRPDVVMLDALGHPRTLPALIQRLQAQVTGAGLAPQWVVEPKADATYPVVGAASIVAKTTRDAALALLKETWGELGSGYPSDPKTKRWLRDWSRSGKPWPAFVRTRWSTITDLAQQGLFADRPPTPEPV